MFIVKNRKIFYLISVLAVVISLLSIIFFGLRFGIDFTGGSILEVRYNDSRPGIDTLEAELTDPAFSGFSLRPTGDNGYIVRTKYLDENKHQELLKALGGEESRGLQEIRFNSIGPAIGEELRTKSSLAIALVILAIVIFIAFAFRKVSEPVSSYKYGFISIIALVHDVVIPTGVFAFLGFLFGTEIDTLFVTALLVILGFSIHDTIVVFDRVRENLKINKEYNKREDFEETVGRSIKQTISRSINTSLTTIIALVVLFFLGSDSTKDFSLALIIGITAGTYSSIFLASPLLVTIEKWQKKKDK